MDNLTNTVQATDVQTKPQLMYFDTDADFHSFCVIPQYKIVQSETGQTYYDFDFTSDYLNALAAGTKFTIRDKNSNVLKHKAVSFGSITKPVQNLKMYSSTIDKKSNTVNTVNEEE